MKVLNIGSLNIDKTYSVKQFVQPKETIKALKYEEFCGGKGLNQSVALAKAGASVYHAGAIGKDGDILADMLVKAGVNTDYIQKLDIASGHAVIQVDENGQNNIIISGGSNVMISKEFISEVLDKFNEGDMVLFQNEISNVGYAIDEAQNRGMIVAFNPSPISEELFTYPLDKIDYFILNEIEGRTLAGISSDDFEVIMNKLKEKYPSASFVLTLGEKGSYFFNKNEIMSQDIYKVNVVDTTGAGDTFCGYFLGGVAQGLSVSDCMNNASAASAIAVSRMGASSSIPCMDEVEKFRR